MFEHSVKVPRLYKTAANIARCVKEEGASIKGLVYELKQQQNIKGVYALVVETLQRSNQIDFLLKKSQILIKETRFDPWLARVLITELLWGKKRLTSESKPIKTILAYHQILLAHFNDVFSAVVKPKVYKPRFVRINTLKLTIDDAVNGFRNEDWTFVRHIDPNDYEGFLHKVSSLTEEEFMVDLHIKDLLIFPHNAQFYNHEAYLNGSIILQDKASCLPVHILNPEPGSVVLDMCAAPGMKTTQIAAIMQNNGTVYAVERDVKRAQMLDKIVENAGATCVKTINKDVLTLTGDDIKNVQYIIVDPTCSGSGMTDRVELGNECSINPARLEKLAGFQIKILKHALRSFPDAGRVVYSTCSVYPQENEEVVKEVISSTPNYKLVSAKHYLSSPWSQTALEDDISCHCIHAKPEVDLTNGFFIAVFEKVGENEENVFLRQDIKNRSKIDTSTNTSAPNLKSKKNCREDLTANYAVCEWKKQKSCSDINNETHAEKRSKCINDEFYCDEPCSRKKKKKLKSSDIEITADKERQRTKQEQLEIFENEITDKLNQFKKILTDNRSDEVFEAKSSDSGETLKKSKKNSKKRMSNISLDEPDLEDSRKSSRKTTIVEKNKYLERLGKGSKKKVICDDFKPSGYVDNNKCLCKEDLGPHIICKSKKSAMDDEGRVMSADSNENIESCACVKNSKEKKKNKKKSTDALSTEDVEMTNIDDRDEHDLEDSRKSSKKTTIVENPEYLEKLGKSSKKKVFCDDFKPSSYVENNKCLCKEDLGPHIICKSKKSAMDDEGRVMPADSNENIESCACVKNSKDKKKNKKKSTDALSTEDVEMTNIDYRDFEEKSQSKPEIDEKLSSKMRNEKHNHRDLKQRCQAAGSEDYEVCICKKCQKRKLFRETETTIFINTKDESIFGKIKDKVYTQQKQKHSSDKPDEKEKTRKRSSSKKSKERKPEAGDESVGSLTSENQEESVTKEKKKSRKKSSLKDNIDDVESSDTITNENQGNVSMYTKKRSKNSNVYDVHFECGGRGCSEQCPKKRVGFETSFEHTVDEKLLDCLKAMDGSYRTQNEEVSNKKICKNSKCRIDAV